MLKKIEQIRKDYELPGMVVGLLRDGQQQIFASGYMDDSQSQTVSADTVYGIGSISKVFTATLAMRLVAHGQLDLDQPIAEFYPNLPIKDDHARASVTMRHLLTHRGGSEGDGFIENGNHDSALAEWVNGFTEYDQVTPPGSAWSYSNNGIGLAGHVLAAVYGSTYEDALREEVFGPLNLHRTGFGQPPAFPNSSMGYEFGKTGVREPRSIDGCARSANPAGGLVSSVPDLLRFASFHLGLIPDGSTTFLPEDLRAAMQQPQVTVNQIEKWGIGWELKLEGPNTWTVEHGGWFNGFRAQLTLFPEQNSALAILTTGPKGHEAIEVLLDNLLEEQFGIEGAPTTTPWAGSSPHWTGTYQQSHIDAEFKISEENNDLILHLRTKWHGVDSENFMVCPLIRVAENEYVVTEGEFIRSRVVFIQQIPGTNSHGARILNRICLPVEDLHRG